MKKVCCLFLLFFVEICFSQMPIESYKQEIYNLKTDIELNNYWNKLLEIDQNILLESKNFREFDSISTSLMVRTALIFEIHGDKAYKPNIYLPILNLSHNNIGESSLVFWSIIEKCAKTGGVIDNFGGKFPAYEIESISLNFYNYSLFNQESKYSELREKLNLLKSESISNELIKTYESQKKTYKLKEEKRIGKWHLQTTKDEFEDVCFEFIRMSDDNIYIKQINKIQKLILLKKNNKYKVFKIENEPFGWTYELFKNGNLFLKNDKHEVLIEYTIKKPAEIDCPQKVRHYLGVFLWKEKSNMIIHSRLSV
jgi:hypothetical protein